MESQRVSHPSAEQVEALVQYLEEKPHLARGFLKNQSAKVKASKEWELISLKLNSIGGGTFKPAKKWLKYWSDKKSAVKKKASARAVARRRTGGGVEAVPELSEIEERIVALMGGGGFATGDVHLQMQVFDEPTPSLDSSPSILSVPIAGPSSEHRVDVYLGTGDGDLTLGHRDLSPVVENLPSHEPITTEPLASTSRQPHQRAETPPCRSLGAVTTPRSRRPRRAQATRLSPPSQRRAQFSSLTEKFLRIEQQRLALEERIVQVFERDGETRHLVAQANLALGSGLKELAEVLNRRLS